MKMIEVMNELDQDLGISDEKGFKRFLYEINRDYRAGILSWDVYWVLIKGMRIFKRMNSIGIQR